MDTLQDKASAFVDGLSKEILYLQGKKKSSEKNTVCREERKHYSQLKPQNN